MKIKYFIMIFFCLLFIFACTERKIYLPEAQPEKEGQIPKKEEKVEDEKYSQKEEFSATQTSELIRKIQDEIKDIHFDFDKYEIRQEDIPTLKKVASLLQKYKNLKVIIEGHCDERGTNEYNFALGQKRANAAKQYLITLGVLPSKIEIISYGEEKPLCTEHNESCWQKNRRAHFVFIEEGK